MDDTGHARITNFCFATVTHDLGWIRASSEVQSRPPLVAPEIVTGEGTYSQEADIFSFAMVMIEVRHQRVFSSGVSSQPSWMVTGVHRRRSFQS